MRIPSLAFTLAFLLVAGPAARAQRDAGPAIEPEAVAALQRMGRHLQTLKAFSVKGLATTEEVLPQGMKARHDTVASMEVVRPNQVRAEQTSDRRHRLVIYDGKTLTVYSKSSGYYAQEPVAGTVYELAGRIEKDYALELPLLDLFAWADESAQPPQLQVAHVVGLSTVRGVACDQYAFRQDGRDWQVWIQRGAQPLPRRLVVTSTRSEARPQYTADYDWTLQPQVAPTAFAFTPPPGAISIPLARIREIAVPPKR